MLERSRRAGRHARRARLLDLHDGRPRSTCRRCRRARIVDPTGVGDAFRGGFMKGLARGADLRGVRAARQRRRDLRARAPRRPEPRLHLGRVRGALRSSTSARSSLANVDVDARVSPAEARCSLQLRADDRRRRSGRSCSSARRSLLAALAGLRRLARGRRWWRARCVYQLGSLICHQRPERSFHLAGVQMPVCARCFGLYARRRARACCSRGGASAGTRRRRDRVRAVLAVAASRSRSRVALEWIGHDRHDQRVPDADRTPAGIGARARGDRCLRIRARAGPTRATT